MSTEVMAGGQTASIRQSWTQQVRTKTRGVSLVGYLSILVFGATFVIWASTAELSSAILSVGKVAAAGNNIIIQHLEGGIIQSINVMEGDNVSRGDVLISLDKTRVDATLNALRQQHIAMQASIVRLRAMRDGLTTLEYPAELIQSAADLGLSDLLAEQEREFIARMARLRSETDIMNQRVASANSSIVGLLSQQEAIETQLDVVNTEVDLKKDLLEAGLAARSEYTMMLRAQADLVGQSGSIGSQIALADARIAEAQEQLVRQESMITEEALTDLNQLGIQVRDLEQQIAAAEDIRQRAEIRVPVDGRIVRILSTSPGAVVRPGMDLVEVLPTSQDLIVETQLRTIDIDMVNIGQTARLRFVALNARVTPEVSATVTYISPDALVDTGTSATYYVARLKITQDLPLTFDADQIFPGMPVEVIFLGQERTFFQYLVQPITESFGRAFTEE